MLKSNDTTGDNSQGSSPTLLQFLEQNLWNRVRVSFGESAQHLEVHAQSSDGCWQHVADFGFVELIHATCAVFNGAWVLEGDLLSFCGPNCQIDVDAWISVGWRAVADFRGKDVDLKALAAAERIRVSKSGLVFGYAG